MIRQLVFAVSADVPPKSAVHAKPCLIAVINCLRFPVRTLIGKILVVLVLFSKSLPRCIPGEPHPLLFLPSPFRTPTLIIGCRGIHRHLCDLQVFCIVADKQKRSNLASTRDYECFRLGDEIFISYKFKG